MATKKKVVGKCTGCKKRNVVEETFSILVPDSPRGRKFGPIPGPTPSKRTTSGTRTTYHCSSCGLVYRFPPPAKKKKRRRVTAKKAEPPTHGLPKGFVFQPPPVSPHDGDCPGGLIDPLPNDVIGPGPTIPNTFIGSDNDFDSEC